MYAGGRTRSTPLGWATADLRGGSGAVSSFRCVWTLAEAQGPDLGYRDATPEDLAALAAWLVARAQEHDKPTVLFQLAAEHLRAAKIVRPGITTLERLVA